MEKELRVNPTKAKHFCVDALARVGVPSDQANIVADSLVLADLRGVSSHGIMRLPTYVRRIRKGVMSAETVLTILRDESAVILLDANNGIGIVAGSQAMQLAIERAQKNGVGVAAVAHSNHCGMMAFFTLMAVQAGMIGIAFSNANAMVLPWGARAPFMGTNPLSIAVPAREEPPLVLDMATSAVARGKVVLMAKQGKSIPEGWVLTPDGRPATEPEEVLSGYLLPFGGAKGSGIALMVEILCGVLTGSSVGPEIAPFFTDFTRGQDLGHLFIALNVKAFVPFDQFTSRVDTIIRQVRSLPPAPGVERIYLPGEIEFLAERENWAKGIPLVPEVCEELRTLAEELNITPLLLR
ncbi:MAG: Ldh family oxidoreductase [Armatimonadota bacterium]|nr:Ldh family oxidoreductase [Armatimonadota bacterium]